MDYSSNGKPFIFICIFRNINMIGHEHVLFISTRKTPEKNEQKQNNMLVTRHSEFTN